MIRVTALSVVTALMPAFALGQTLDICKTVSPSVSYCQTHESTAPTRNDAFVPDEVAAFRLRSKGNTLPTVISFTPGPVDVKALPEVLSSAIAAEMDAALEIDIITVEDTELNTRPAHRIIFDARDTDGDWRRARHYYTTTLIIDNGRVTAWTMGEHSHGGDLPERVHALALSQLRISK